MCRYVHLVACSVAYLTCAVTSFLREFCAEPYCVCQTCRHAPVPGGSLCWSICGEAAVFSAPDLLLSWRVLKITRS